MRIEVPALVVSLRPHGEHGAVVRLMTRDHGLQAAYVRGARGRRLGPVLVPGNQVQASLSARTDTQLPQATVELIHSRGPLLAEPLPAAAIDWSCALTAGALPEAQPYPRLYDALDGLLAAIEAAPAASGWGAALVRYELLVLAELGFGLDPPPAFLLGEVKPGWTEILDGLRTSGHFLDRDILTDRLAPLGDARSRLIDRLRRASGLA